MFYVSMIDTFMSNWGPAKNKDNVLIFECETWQEAEIVEQNATKRSDMAKIRTHAYYPQFNKSKCFVQDKTKDDYPVWYQKGAF